MVHGGRWGQTKAFSVQNNDQPFADWSPDGKSLFTVKQIHFVWLKNN
jgi:hypothetical protein